MANQQDSSFLESFGRTLGQLPMGIKSVMLERGIELELEKEKKKLDEQLARQQAAITMLGQLDRQKDLAADWQKDYGNKPEAAGLHGPMPEWGREDQLQEYFQYGQAGLNPEAIAKADKERLLLDMLQKGSAGITNPVMQANLGLGKELQPVQLEGGNYYNPYDTTNFQLGTTAENLQDVRLKTSEADEQEQRLALINDLPNEIMRLNAFNSKELGKPIEAEVEGPDGQTHKALITQDSSGGYHHSTVTDKAGNPLVIPPEAVGGGDSGLTTDQKNVAFYAKLWKKTPAETAEILKSKSLYSDDGFIESRLIANSKGSFGSRNSDKKILTATFDDFVRARHGSYFPEHFINEVNRSKTMSATDKETLIADIEKYNQEVFEMQLAGGLPGVTEPSTGISQPIPNPVIAPPPTVQTPPVQPAAAPPPPVQAPVTMPPPDMAPAPMVQPAAPAPIPEPPPAPDFMAFAETVMTNDSPATINAALKKQGFDLSSQAMGAMAIDAINQGVSVQDIQQLYQLLGIQWTPPA